MTATAMFGALSYVCMILIKIPVSFLTLDLKDAFIVLCSLLFGPLAGAVIAILVPFFEMITVSGTGGYGFIMNALSSLTFALVTGCVYRYKKTMTGAIVGLCSGVFAVTAVMMLANLLITPYYLGAKPAEVAALIPKLLLPFNLVKATLNAAIVLLLYKPLSRILKKIGFLYSAHETEGVSAKSHGSRLRSLLITSAAVLIIAASLAVIFFVLKK